MNVAGPLCHAPAERTWSHSWLYQSSLLTLASSAASALSSAATPPPSRERLRPPTSVSTSPSQLACV